jgi:hypothetical protein
MFFDRCGCLIAGALVLAVLSAAACEKKGEEGPAERAGEQVDKAKESIKEATKDAEAAASAAGGSAKELVRGPSR